MAEIVFGSVENQPIQVIPGDFYLTDDHAVVSLVEYDKTFALFNALTGQLHAYFMSKGDMYTHLNSETTSYSHRPKSKIVIA